MRLDQNCAVGPQELAAQQNVNPALGLSDVEVCIRQKTFGKNTFASEQVTWVQVLLRQIFSPFAYMLFAAALLSLFLGEYINVIMLGIFIVINTVFGFFQEYNAERTLELLTHLVTTKATVRRNGRDQEIDTADIVPGDVVLLEPGDVVPADLCLIEAAELEIDEAVLTGESMPVEKNTGSANQAHAGTTVVTGRAVGIVLATGDHSALGHIARQTTELKRESLFAQNIKTFTYFMMGLISITLTGIILLHTILKPGQMGIGELMLFAIALSVSMLPEGLPVVMTFCLAKGASKLAAAKVVAKRLSAVEDLGSIQILCTDKTGTLTENNLAVADVYGERTLVLEAALRANQTVLPAKRDAARSFDEALVTAGVAQCTAPRLVYLPFDHRSYCSHVLVELTTGFQAVIRGTPEHVLARCSGGEQDSRDLQAWSVIQGKQGRRVIAVATKPLTQVLTSDQLVQEQAFLFAGLISFEDQIKPSAHEAISRAQSLGVQVKMVTGDTPEVAGAVGHAIGLISDPSHVITEAQLVAVDDDHRRHLYEKYTVFARMSPHRKYEMIQALQLKHTVGFMGEGINDAPALKVAHVALVVDNGTDVAKGAADLILLDKALQVIVDGIAEGRKIVANTIKYIQLMMICNIANFYSIAIASLTIDFLPMLPLQILLVNILSDLPLIAIATDHVVHEDINSPKKYLFGNIVKKAMVMGLISTAFDFIMFRRYFTTPQMLQTVWFMYSVCSEIAMFYVLRTRHFFWAGHRPPFGLLSLSLMAGLAALVLPLTGFGQLVFKFCVPPVTAYLFLFVLLMGEAMTMELVKRVYRRVTGF